MFRSEYKNGMYGIPLPLGFLEVFILKDFKLIGMSTCRSVDSKGFEGEGAIVKE